MEDERIVELYWKRSEIAIEETNKKYGRYIKSIAMNILGSESDAEEAINDTYLDTWNTIPPNKPKERSSVRLQDGDRWIFLGRKKRHGADGAKPLLCLRNLKNVFVSHQDPTNILKPKHLPKPSIAFSVPYPNASKRFFSAATIMWNRSKG